MEKKKFELRLADEQSPDKVWVVRYEHKHGTDVLVFRREQRALEWISETIESWMEELESVAHRRDVTDLLGAGKIREAARLWEELHPNSERFEISQTEIEE